MIIRRILFLLCLLPLLVVIMILSAIDDTPKLSLRAHLTPTQIARAKQLFDRNDPRRVRAGSITTASLSQEELDLALNYASNQYLNGVASLKIETGKAHVAMTLPLPDNPLGRYLNLQIELKQTTERPEISGLKIGALQIPAFLVKNLVRIGQSAMPSTIDWQQLAHTVKKFSLPINSLSSPTNGVPIWRLN